VAQCLLDDAGLSIGLVSLPFQQERLFYGQEIRPIFSGYRDNVRQFFLDSSDARRKDFDALYRPRPYYLFGRFDLALLYLVDDHDFSCRTLRPFHPKAPGGRKKYPENFVYKVLFGPTPRFSPANVKPEGVIQLLAKAGTPPLIGITQLKVNNSLLLGGGATFLRLVVNFIKEEAGAFEREIGDRLIILESYAWHEITLVMLGRAYTRMLDFVTRLRDASYSDLVGAAYRRAATASERRDTEDELHGLHHLAGPDLGWTRRQLDRAPIFGNLTTTLGFDFRMFRDRGLTARIDPGDRIHLSSRWYVKPGRIGEFRATVAGRDSLVCAVGRGDVWYRPGAGALDRRTAHAQTRTRDAIRRYLHENQLRGLKNMALQRYTRAASVPAIRSPVIRRRRFADRLGRLKIQAREIRAVDRAMRRLRVPKVLIHRILNVYANFNDGTLDRNLYASFAELRPFLERVSLELVAESRAAQRTVSHEELCRRIRKWCGNFERAYRNRFHNSERMGEITDFNFEFKGGIQQVVTAFDAAYKALSSVLGSPGSFVSVGADPGVDSTECEVRLNYFHVFQPEMFFAVAGKEAANWFVAKHGIMLDEVVIGLMTTRPDLRACRDEYVRRRVGQAFARMTVDPEVRVQARHWVNVPFLRTHLAEVLTYQVCYAGNWDLFSYWTLGSFLQMAGAYEPRERLDGIEVARFLFRLRMVAGDIPVDRFAGAIASFGDKDICDIYESLAADLETVRHALLRRTCLGTWFASVRRSSDAMSRLALAEPAFRGALEDVQASALADAGDARDAIFEGHVPRFERDGPFAAFRFCQRVLCGYLLLLKKRWGGPPPRLRRKNSAPIVTKDSSKLLFDPMGGVFSHEASARRELFKYRSAVTMSLWDMGLKMKREQLARHMKDGRRR